MRLRLFTLPDSALQLSKGGVVRSDKRAADGAGDRQSLPAAVHDLLDNFKAAKSLEHRLTVIYCLLWVILPVMTAPIDRRYFVIGYTVCIALALGYGIYHMLRNNFLHKCVQPLSDAQEGDLRLLQPTVEEV